MDIIQRLALINKNARNLTKWLKGKMSDERYYAESKRINDLLQLPKENTNVTR